MNQPLPPQSVITVRIPTSLHEQLKLKAHEKRTSLNLLCVDTLRAVVQPKDQK